jgi:DNA-binding NarL/FixJ family response regulator
MAIRVLLADEHPLAWAGLRAMLDATPDICRLFSHHPSNAG